MRERLPFPTVSCREGAGWKSARVFERAAAKRLDSGPLRMRCAAAHGLAHQAVIDIDVRSHLTGASLCVTVAHLCVFANITGSLT
jgi:hypothetical protein